MRSTKGRWYVSYAWADDSAPKLEEKVDALCDAAENRGIRIFRDKNTLIRGDSISEFMAELGEGDRIFIFFSKQYLQSPYCMFEMSEMWRNSRQNKRELLSRVRFFFADTERISKPNDWIKHITFWIEERDELGRAIDVIGWRAAGEETLKRYWLMQKFVGELSNILSLFADVNNPRDMNDFQDEDLLIYAFGDLPRAPQFIRTQLDREPLQNI